MVRPIAIQDNLGKTLAAEKITQVEKSQPELAQRETKETVRRKNVEQQRKPQEAEKSDEVIIHHEKRQQQNGKGQGREPEAETPAEEGQDNEEEQPDETIKHLDVRV